jgi:nucleoid-associated protein YgaU
MSTLQIASPARQPAPAARRGTPVRTRTARPAPARPVAARPAAGRPVRGRAVTARRKVERPFAAWHFAGDPVATARPAARRTRRPAAAAAPLRLTRRGRVVVTLLVLGLLLLATTFIGARSAATRETGTPVHTRTVVVDQGDTMWGIAAQVAHGRDIRAVIHDIEELNALTGPELVEGQKIAVPVG